MELEDRVVLITGAARRVGRAIALRLAGAGCRIALHYHNSEDDARETATACRALGAIAELFRADLAEMAATERLVPAVLEQFGRLDVLVNNASVFERMAIDSFRREDWERTLRINLTAPMLLTHAARGALEQGHGRVINLCDSATPQPWPGYLAYAVSKGALETLTRVLARALAPRINVIGIAPGAVAWPEEYDGATRARLTAKIPLRRAGTEDDIATIVHFVLREGDYITGAIIPVDGGRQIV